MPTSVRSRRGISTSIRSSSTISRLPTIPTDGSEPSSGRREPPGAGGGERAVVVVAISRRRPRRSRRGRVPRHRAARTRRTCRAAPPRPGGSGPGSSMPSASAIASETPPSAWSALVCAVSSAQFALTSVASVRPLGSVAGKPCTGVRNSGWCTTSRSAPRVSASSATSGVGSTANITLRAGAAGSPYTTKPKVEPTPYAITYALAFSPNGFASAHCFSAAAFRSAISGVLNDHECPNGSAI